jgi:hypothetical protein
VARIATDFACLVPVVAEIAIDILGIDQVVTVRIGIYIRCFLGQFIEGRVALDALGCGYSLLGVSVAVAGAALQPSGDMSIR